MSMENIIRVKDQYYILAASSLADAQRHALNHNGTFAIFDRHGDMRSWGLEDHGLYHEGTRFLSRLDFSVESKTPLLLSSTVQRDNDLIAVDLMNPDFMTPQGITSRGTIHFSRSIFLWQACCYERLQISNYGLAPTEFLFTLEFDADYVDIFEVRGLKRPRRGEILEPQIEGNQLILSYRGLDGVMRKSVIHFQPEPESLETYKAVFKVQLVPHEKKDFYFSISCQIEAEESSFLSYEVAYLKMKDRMQNRLQASRIETSNKQLNDWLDRSYFDLNMMLTETPFGFYPYAGIPWFSTVFGRDGLITAFETLWICPDIAKGVLSFLASHQAKEVNESQDAEPGKILHEMRKGEMAALGEIPFGCYYGSVDSTPLFVILAGYYYERTADLDYIAKLWPHIEQALMWIDQYGDRDGDGFVEYEKMTQRGLSHQGWKDSEEAVFHKDGTHAKPPIALCEVQGYVYEAKKKAAALALILGKKEIATRLLSEAEALKIKFQKEFWCDELGIYAIALDGDKKQCQIKSSNAGQTLFSGIASQDHAYLIAKNLNSSSFFSGWGIRTLAAGEPRYNPMSYHNGSIWPHDNALIAYGFSRYHLKDETLKVLTALFDASTFMDLQRLPELFCGFARRQGEGPTLYPVACDPQAWAAASVYLLLESCLGLVIKASENKIYFHYPVMPVFLEEIRITHLSIGRATLDLAIRRNEGDVSIHVLKREGYIEVVSVK